MKLRTATIWLLCLLVTIWLVNCGPSPEPEQAGAEHAEGELDEEMEEAEEDIFPPEGSKPISEIAKAVEDMGYGSIREIEYEEEGWEVEAMKDGQVLNLLIDPSTGEILEPGPQ